MLKRVAMVHKVDPLIIISTHILEHSSKLAYLTKQGAAPTIESIALVYA